jgi:hypothetical protein
MFSTHGANKKLGVRRSKPESGAKESRKTFAKLGQTACPIGVAKKINLTDCLADITRKCLQVIHGSDGFRGPPSAADLHSKAGRERQ